MNRFYRYQLERNDYVIELVKISVKEDYCLSAEDIFINYCSLTDYPEGATQFLLIEALKSGFQLTRVDSDNNRKVLVEMDEFHNLYGYKKIINFLGYRFIPFL